MGPTVSVIIPVFNRPVAVRRAIDSVLAQTFQDFDIVVVDDGSTDETAATVATFTDPRIKLLRHDHKRGGSAARNTGIGASLARYVAFLDSDDEWLPTKLQRQLDVFERSDDRLGLVYTGIERVYGDGSSETHIPSKPNNIFRALLTTNVIGETSVGMVRRSVLERTGGFDESLPASQEMDLWLRICEQFSVDLVPEVLVRVAKGSCGDRITSNIAATTGGRELFRRKHGKKMAEHGVLHRYLRRSGWWYQRGARDTRQARRCYLEALAVKPASPVTYLLLLLACLPLSWVDRMARLKHLASRVQYQLDIRVADRPRRTSKSVLRDTTEHSQPS